MLTHGNLLSNARTLKNYWHWKSPEAGGDVLIHALPIFPCARALRRIPWRADRRQPDDLVRQVRSRGGNCALA